MRLNNLFENKVTFKLLCRKIYVKNLFTYSENGDDLGVRCSTAVKLAVSRSQLEASRGSIQTEGL